MFSKRSQFVDQLFPFWSRLYWIRHIHISENFDICTIPKFIINLDLKLIAIDLYFNKLYIIVFGNSFSVFHTLSYLQHEAWAWLAPQKRLMKSLSPLWIGYASKTATVSFFPALFAVLSTLPFRLPNSKLETQNLTATALMPGAFGAFGVPSGWLAFHAEQVLVSSTFIINNWDLSASLFMINILMFCLNLIHFWILRHSPLILAYSTISLIFSFK